MKIELINISKLHVNPANPRIIKDEKFKALVESIKKFPQMLDIRPIVCNKEFMILGGDKRFKAAKAAGMKDVPCIIADNLDEMQQKEFIIRDNVSSGDWDFKLLADDWDESFLNDIGVEIPDFTETKISKEIQFSTNRTIKLKYSEKDFDYVNSNLNEVADTPEAAVMALIHMFKNSKI